MRLCPGRDLSGCYVVRVESVRCRRNANLCLRLALALRNSLPLLLRLLRRLLQPLRLLLRLLRRRLPHLSRHLLLRLLCLLLRWRISQRKLLLLRRSVRLKGLCDSTTVVVVVP